MKKATGTAFESDYGFKSPSFTVDALGNIIANSITTTEPISGGGGTDGATLTNFKVTENVDGTVFQFSGVTGGNPTIELERGKTYSFELELTTLTFSVFLADGTSTFPNITDQDGNTGASANGKSTGVIQLTITSDTPNTLVYKNEDGSVSGQFSIINPTGSFGSIAVTNTTQATGLNTGSLRVAGGASITKNLYVGGNFVLEGVGDVKFDSSSNLTIGAQNKVLVVIDGSLIGSIDNQGSSIPVVNTNIDNTVIGETTPTTATFTSADVTETPTTVNNVTNKAYVDKNDIALSIALGS